MVGLLDGSGSTLTTGWGVQEVWTETPFGLDVFLGKGAIARSHVCTQRVNPGTLWHFSPTVFCCLSTSCSGQKNTRVLVRPNKPTVFCLFVFSRFGGRGSGPHLRVPTWGARWSSFWHASRWREFGGCGFGGGGCTGRIFLFAWGWRLGWRFYPFPLCIDRWSGLIRLDLC